MKKKLTLRLEPDAIERAKIYADARGTSVSKLVESFFNALNSQNAVLKPEISPFIESLRGIAAADATEIDYYAHLEHKHR